jgi:hypothetical protein
LRGLDESNITSVSHILSGRGGHVLAGSNGEKALREYPGISNVGAKSQKVLGEEHPDTLTNMNNLMPMLNSQGTARWPRKRRANVKPFEK